MWNLMMKVAIIHHLVADDYRGCAAKTEPIATTDTNVKAKEVKPLINYCPISVWKHRKMDGMKL